LLATVRLHQPFRGAPRQETGTESRSAIAPIRSGERPRQTRSKTDIQRTSASPSLSGVSEFLQRPLAADREEWVSPEKRSEYDGLRERPSRFDDVAASARRTSPRPDPERERKQPPMDTSAPRPTVAARAGPVRTAPVGPNRSRAARQRTYGKSWQHTACPEGHKAR